MLSVIIPAYNEEKYIEETLKSIKSQSFKDYELIVVCNGCTDKTARISRKYTNKVYEIKKGAIRAKNFGAKKARYEKLVFLDADTILTSKTLESISKINSFGTCLGEPLENKLKFKLLCSTKNLFCEQLKLFNGILFCKKEDFFKIKGFDDIHPLENKYLRKKLKKISNYYISREKVKTSMRRYDKEGLVLPILKLIVSTFKKDKRHIEIR